MTLGDGFAPKGLDMLKDRKNLQARLKNVLPPDLESWEANYDLTQFRAAYNHVHLNTDLKQAVLEGREQRQAMHARSKHDQSDLGKKKKVMIGGVPAEEVWAKEKQVKLAK